MLFCRICVLFIAIFSYAFSKDNCNPLACYYFANRIFSLEEEDVCKSFQELKKCLQVCFPSDDDSNWLVKGLANAEQNLCDKFIDNSHLKSECFNQKKFQLGACIFKSWNIALDNQNNTKQILTDLLECRKITEAENCPATSLSSCSQTVITLIEELIVQLFEPFKHHFCFDFSSSDIWNLDITSRYSTKNVQGIVNLATCFDLRQKQIDACIPTKGVSNVVVLNSHTSIELCLAVTKTLDCANRVVLSECGIEVSESFRQVEKNFYRILMPICTLTSTSVTIPKKTTSQSISRDVSKNTAVDQPRSSSSVRKSTVLQQSYEMENAVTKYRDGNQDSNKSVINEDYAVSDIYIFHVLHKSGGTSEISHFTWPLVVEVWCTILYFNMVS